MTDDISSKIYQDAWDTWGGETQIDILIEEMSELTHALLKARRRGIFYDMQVFFELVDVKICIGQLENYMLRSGMDPTLISARTDVKLRYIENLVRESRRVERDNGAKAI